jgi:triosephosphate isomerase
MATKLIVGNWKMHLAPQAAAKYAKKLEDKLPSGTKTSVVLCPPSVSIFAVSEALEGKALQLGAQNINPNDEGPYTGEISATMLQGIAKYTIVGHSERRAMGEHDKLIAEKVAAAIRNDIIPILCVGETLDERHHDLSTKVVIDQLTSDLHMLTAEDVAKIVIAYEPVWAIGTGVSATPEQIEPMIRAIRTTIEDLYGESGGQGVRVLYGAGVKVDFVSTILSIDGIDGLLVGGSSLVADEFLGIIAAAEQLA